MNEKLFAELEDFGVEVFNSIERLGLSEDDYANFLKMFIQKESLDNLENAINSCNHEVSEREAHTIKGVALNLGILPLADLCTDMVYLYRQGNHEEADDIFADVKRCFDKLLLILEINK